MLGFCYTFGSMFYGISEKNNAEVDKPNEDGFWIDESSMVAVIVDGVTRFRKFDGSYPHQDGLLAAETVL